MKIPFIALLLIPLLISCSDDNTSTNSDDNTPPKIELDHSGLEPITADLILENEYLSAGDATVFLKTKDAFSTRPDPISDDFALDANFTSGDHLFRTPHADIGPMLSTGTCQGCHLNDGRGVLPENSDSPMFNMLFKIGDELGNADPIYGGQLQPFSIQGFNSSDITQGYSKHNGSINGTELYGEAFPYIEYEVITGDYPDGETYSLRKPTYKVKELSYGAFMDDVRFSPRLAPQMIGVGLLGEIPEANLIALADEFDDDNDGISGKVSYVTDAVSGEIKVGRFAYKAQNPTILQQVSGAYSGDIGLTTSIFPDESCTDNQVACQVAAEDEDKVETEVDLSDLELALVEFYTRVLGVPVRRGFDTETNEWSADVLAGRQLFYESKCTACHTPRHVTGDAAGSVLGEITFTSLEDNAESIEMLSNQTIYPYTDLLLHDMGGSCSVSLRTSDDLACKEGDECTYVQQCTGLADGLIQGDAEGTEWKTPALWGLGLVQTVNPNATFLHDGRARTIEEAILWHGGEAENSKLSFMSLNKTERNQIITFLNSL